MTERMYKNSRANADIIGVGSTVTVACSDDLFKLTTEAPSNHDLEVVRIVDPEKSLTSDDCEPITPEQLHLIKAISGLAVGNTTVYESLDGKVTFARLIEVS